MWTREELKQNAKQIMSKNYWKMLGVSLVSGILMGTIFETIYQINDTINQTVGFEQDPLYSIQIDSNYNHYFLIFISALLGASIFMAIFNFIYSLFIGNIIQIGDSKYFINNRKNQGTIKNLFFSFNHNYMNAVKIMFFMNLKIFLWSLLFIVPGIIKSYEYSMIPYILAEDPDLSSEEVFSLTHELTYHEKWKIFVLDLSFIGWLLLGAIACGIGTIFVTPYMRATTTELYFKLKEIKGIRIGTDIPPVPDYSI